MNCFYLNTFYSVLTFLYFYKNTIIFYTNNFIPIFILILIIIVMIIFVTIVFAIAIIISSFSMFLTLIFLDFTILFYFCIYQIFLNLKQMMWPKDCS